MNLALRIGLAVCLPLALVVGVLLYFNSSGGASDMNGEYVFTVDLEEDRGTMPEEEIVVYVDLMQDQNDYLTGTGTAEYGSNEFTVEVTEGQVSTDGELYLALYGYDYGDIFNFELYGDGNLEGSAEGRMYYEGDERAAKALAISFAAE